MRYRNRNTGEERVTVDGSRLDKRIAADPNWEPAPDEVPAEPTYHSGGIIAEDNTIGLTADVEDAA